MEPKKPGEAAVSPPSAIRVARVEALLVPEVQDLLNAGLADLYRAGVNPDRAWTELAKLVSCGESLHGGLFVGAENDKFLSFLILEPPRLPWHPFPHILHYQNLGSSKLKRLMREQLLAYVRGLGYTTITFTNSTSIPDSVYIRAQCRNDRTQIVGSRIMWDIGEDGRSKGLVRGN